MVNVVDQTQGVREDARVTDITRLLLEARRSLASELDADLGERGYPDLRPGHAALFLSVDRRSGSRLTDLAEQTRLTKQAMMSMVDDPENRGHVRRGPAPVAGAAGGPGRGRGGGGGCGGPPPGDGGLRRSAAGPSRRSSSAHGARWETG